MLSKAASVGPICSHATQADTSRPKGELRPSVSLSVSLLLVQSLSRVRLLATPWTAARQASLSITNSQSLLKLMSIESVMPSKHLLLCRPLLLPPSILPASGSFTPNVDPAEASQERNTQPPETWDKCKCHEADGWQRSRRIQGERLTVLPRLGPFTLGESKNWMSVSLLVPFTRKK